jgi:hypothetical protein
MKKVELKVKFTQKKAKKVGFNPGKSVSPGSGPTTVPHCLYMVVMNSKEIRGTLPQLPIFLKEKKSDPSNRLGYIEE